VVAGAVVLVGVAAVVYRGGTRTHQQNAAEDKEVEATKASRPFALRPALVLAVVLTFALLVGRWGADILGPKGVVLATFAAGLADAHAGAVAAASLAAKGDITVDTALVAVAAALGSNLLVKTVLAFTAGGRRFGLGFLAAMAVPVLVFGVALTAAVAVV
jgi:uncharacterized membrane protein (DUF4010 family)